MLRVRTRVVECLDAWGCWAENWDRSTASGGAIVEIRLASSPEKEVVVERRELVELE